MIESFNIDSILKKMQLKIGFAFIVFTHPVSSDRCISLFAIKKELAIKQKCTKQLKKTILMK